MTLIDVEGMARVVKGLEDGVDTLRHVQDSLRGVIEHHGLDPSRVYAIASPVAWATRELPGVRRRLALAQDLEGSNPSWPQGTADVPDSAVPTLDPSVAQQLGKQVAQQLRAADGKLDDELVAQLEANCRDPYFASALARELGVDELARITRDLSYIGGTDAIGDGGSTWYRRSITALGAAFGTATRATGELALPPGYAKQWVEQLTGQTNRSVYPDATSGTDYANALAALVGSGRWDEDFLVDVTSGAIDYERGFDDPIGVWLDRGNQNPSMQGYMGVYGADGQRVIDPVAALLAAAAKQPAAAQRILVGGDKETVELGGEKVEVSSRLRHLVEDRDWQFDDGSAFGSALVAATTELRNREVTGVWSAQIATEAIALLGAHTGYGAHDAYFLTPSDPGWQLPEGMRGSVAKILAAYSFDMVEAVAVGIDDLSDKAILDRRTLPDGTSPLLYGEGMPYGAAFDADLLEPLIATLGQDRANLDVVLAGLAVASNQRLGTALEQTLVEVPDAPVKLLSGDVSIPRIENTLITTSNVLGWVVENGLQGAESEQALAKERAEAMSQALSTASSLPFMPKLSNENVQWVLDQVLDEAIDKMGEVDASKVVKGYDSIDRNVPRAAIDNALNALLQAGYLTDDTFAAANEQVGGNAYVPPPAQALVPGSDPPRFDTKSPAYLSWLNDHAPINLLQNTVLDSYDTAWGHTG